MPRLAIVLSHPTQYYSPWFRWLAAHAALELRVFYLWDFGVTAQRDPEFGTELKWDVDLLSGYAHEFVPNVARRPGTQHFAGLNNPSLLPRLEAWQPDAVLLFGYPYRTHLHLLLNSAVPVIFRGDSHLIEQSPSWLKRILLRAVYARCTAVTYVGQANRDYFRAFGVPDRKLHFVPHCVDDTLFRRSPRVEEAAANLRAKLGLDGRRVILFAGKLVRGKQPAALLDSYLALAPPDAALVFVGEGPERSPLEAKAAQSPGACVRFLPFANQTEMPVRYALADLFVLPSNGETWGLAVNEAMHLGVPCVVSSRVGCQRDLVLEGETGWVFPASEPSALVATLARALAAVRGDAALLRARVTERIAGYTYAVAGRNLAAALDTVVPQR